MSARALPRVLLGNEMLKMWKRLATWVTVGFFSFITVMDLGEEFFDARESADRSFALPDAWQDILGGDAMIGLIFGSVLVILLVAAEFSWRTARQNVIDGLSKSQWFAAKLMLVPIIGFMFLAARTGFGGVLAWIGTDMSQVTGSLLGAPQWAAFGGIFLASLGFGSLALAVATMVRSAGPAMAIWFFYIAMGEKLLVLIVGKSIESTVPFLQYLPANAFQGLTNYEQYDPVAFERAVQWAVENERPAPEAVDMQLLAAVVAAWIAVFVATSYLSFRKRDM